MSGKKWVIAALIVILALIVYWGSSFWPADPKADDRLVLEGEGIFVGQIDSHSVEIIIAGQPRAFGLDGGISVTGIRDGSTVTFTYTEEETRPILLSIKAVEADSEIIRGEGIFTGQIDSHSVELVIDNQPTAFALSDELSIGHIKEGSRVAFTYRKEETRSILLFIEMIDEPEVGGNGDLVGEGILEGQIDAQSVEILLNRVFILGDDVNIDGIVDGSLVAFTYSVSGHRAILDSIMAVGEPVEGAFAHGILIGLSDSQSVEIQYYKAFALGAGVDIEGIADGSEVIFTYQEGTHRPVLTSIIAK